VSSTKQRLLSRLGEVCAGLGGAKCSPGAKLLRSGVAQHENARAGWSTCADATRVFHGACGYADSGALGQANAHVGVRDDGAAASVFYIRILRDFSHNASLYRGIQRFSRGVFFL